jgi:hypothetical protein
MIEAVRDAEAHELELDCLEWKSRVELREKRWKAEIARQVLGFANRDPDVAARTFEGSAYLLMGVEPGGVCGIQPVDAAELEDGVTRYVGTDGPQWDPRYEEVGRATVLVVTVEPPRWGQGAFRLRREVSFDDDEGRTIHWHSGDTFIRRRGKTEKATAADLDMLDRRLLARTDARAARALHLGLADHETVTIPPIDMTEDARRRWIQSQRVALLTPLEQIENATPEQRRELLAEDTSDVDSYTQAVEKYLREAERTLLAELQLRALER